MKLRLCLLVVMAALFAACGAATTASPTPGSTMSPSSAPTDGPMSTPPPSSAPTPSATATGADPDEAAVKIEEVGGMLPPWMRLQFYPSAALYVDGRLIVQGPQIDIYPGPALPNLQVIHFSQRGVQQVLDWAAEAGLEGEDRQLGEAMLDAPVMMFTIVRPEGTHRTSVTNLGEAGVEIAAAAQFLELMQNLPEWLPDEVASAAVPYEWDRLRVVSSPADPTVVADPDLASEMDWPLADLATLGESLSEPPQYRCFVIEGADGLAELRPIFEQANQLTEWNSGGEQYQLQFHPLLPDDEECPGF